MYAYNPPLPSFPLPNCLADLRFMETNKPNRNLLICRARDATFVYATQWVYRKLLLISFGFFSLLLFATFCRILKKKMLIYSRLGYLRLVRSFEGVFYIDFCRYYSIVCVYLCVCVCGVYVYHMFSSMYRTLQSIAYFQASAYSITSSILTVSSLPPE